MANQIMQRPRYHFTAQRGWINDPNGLFFDGKHYQLYFQHNPADTGWDNMHWGHAVSEDLLHWRELPLALVPKSPDDLCFSGSAFLDRNNVSGLGRDGIAPVLAYFTSTGRGECLVSSLDGGVTFTEYSGNPVVSHAGRDPKVIADPAGDGFLMAVYEEVNFIAFYRSHNLRDWTFLSKIHGFYECPEFFQLNGRWVLLAADGTYSVGDFDGVNFIPQTLTRKFLAGDLYAGQSFNHLDRRVMLFWLRDQGLFRHLGFNQQLSIPVELRLENNVLKTASAVEVPGMFAVKYTGRLNIAGKAFELKGNNQIIIDTGSVEVFVNDGETFCGVSTAVPRANVLCFGEVLFDCFSDYRKLAGAPLNLARTIQTLGGGSAMLSAVGDDELGREALAELGNELAKYVSVNTYPTGVAEITLDEHKVPAFVLAADTAYDHIAEPENFDGDWDAVAFGTLAQRNLSNLQTLQRLRQKTAAKFFCDLNLRQPFWTPEIVDLSLNLADCLKLSADEKIEVAKLYQLSVNNEEFCPPLAQKFSLQVILITEGPEGGFAWTAAEQLRFAAPEVAHVVNTVGAGDAFASGFLYHWLIGSSLAIACAAGCACAARVLKGL